jgi:hypothetical protein
MCIDQILHKIASENGDGFSHFLGKFEVPTKEKLCFRLSITDGVFAKSLSCA